MSALDFATFFEDVYGHPPLPWQARLARQLVETSVWPELIDLPTASGKTACLDVAIFHLAHCALRGEPWKAARRIVFMVDRRIIVDAAYERAEKLVAALESPATPVIRAVAEALQTLGGEKALQAQRLRGGMPRDPGFLLSPVQPMVITSTVDQIGSRLLFRGYGLSPYAWPLHAGLLGHDTLLLLDEAHLAQPFIATVNDIRREQARAVEPVPTLQPLRLVRLSATAAPTQTVPFRLIDADYANPLIQQRRSAPKPARLIEVGAKPAERVKALAQETLAIYDALTGKPAVAVIVNRVRTARALFEHLRKARKANEIEFQLMIGRSRPLDRDNIAKQVLARAGAGRPSGDDDKGLIVVATQTIEVGADLDFQGLVTECASLDALRQRFGRLDRLGRYRRAQAAIIGGGDEDNDPVYGKALNATWRWLQQHAESENGIVDFSIAALELKLAATADLAALSPPPPQTLVLTPEHVTLLAQTAPRSEVEPDIAALLHGAGRDEAEIQVVWRAGLPDAEDRSRSDNERLKNALVTEILTALPPLSAEALSLPLRTLRQWLREERGSDDLHDLEGMPAVEEKESRGKAPLLWCRRDDSWARRSIYDVRPGETVVVPADFGGCDQYGFAPDDATPVTDLAVLARQQMQRAPVFLWRADELFPAVAKLEGQLDLAVIDEKALVDLWQALKQQYRETELDDADLFSSGLEAAAFDPEQIEKWVKAVEITSLSVPTSSSERSLYGFLIRLGNKPAFGDFSDEEDAFASRTTEIGLLEHCRGVGQIAGDTAQALGLPAATVALLRGAGLAHDYGKADPRFQRLLRGRAGAADQPLLAKSRPGVRVPKTEPSERHEAYSVALLDAHPEWFSDVEDRDLLRYLVGSHHGRGRPFMPDPDDDGAVINAQLGDHHLHFDGAPRLGVIGSGWPVLFHRLLKRYGPWGLAYREMLLRLADYRRSRDEVDESKGGEAP